VFALRAAYARKTEDTDVPRAKICPLLPVWNTQIRRTTVDGGLASLASPGLPLFGLHRQNYWKMELTPFRCSVPHSPSLGSYSAETGCRKEGVAGTIARIFLRSMAGSCHRSSTDPAVETHRICSNLRSYGFRIRTEPSNDTKETARGQVSPGIFRPWRFKLLGVQAP